jgi:hypothetical protein
MRTVSSTLKTILAGHNIPARLIVRINLASGIYYGCDGEQDISWGGFTYTAFGDALQIDPQPVKADGKGASAVVKLSGTDSTVLSTFFQQVYKGRNCTAALLVGDPATGLPFEEVPIISGPMDTVALEHQPQSIGEPGKKQIATLTLTVSAATSEMTRPGTRVRSDADQRYHRDSVDGFFKDVAQVGKIQIFWGRDGATAPATVVPNAGFLGLGGLRFDGIANEIGGMR